MRHVRPLLVVALVALAAIAVACGSEGNQVADTSRDVAAHDRATAAAAAAEAARGEAEAAATVIPPAEREAPVLIGRAPRLGGGVEPLARYRGDVVLLVNTATECGFTDQFGELQEAYERWQDTGVAILGMPSNDFGDQEPRSDAEIAEFCELNYGVDFPMFAKTTVVGPDAHPMYRAIAARTGPQSRPPEWNFTKYVLDQDGRLAARLAPWLSPTGPEAAAAVATLLAEDRAES